MRKLLPLVMGIVLLVPGPACNMSQGGLLSNTYLATGFEVVIRVVDAGNVIDKIMEAFDRNGIAIAGIKQIFLANERQEFRVSARCGNSKQLNGVEQELRSKLAIGSILIRRI